MFRLSQIKRLSRYYKTKAMFKTMRSDEKNAEYVNIFVEKLGLNEQNAKQYVRKNRITQIQAYRLLYAIEFLQKNNFNREHILEYPDLLRFRYSWEEYLVILRECGCKHNNLIYIKHFKDIMQSTIKTLKEENMIKPDLIVAEHILQHSNVNCSFDVSDLQDDDHELQFVQMQVAKRFLKYRLDTTDEFVDHTWKLYKCIKFKSLSLLNENIENALSFGYSKRGVLRNGYIMHVNPRITNDLLTNMPYFCGTSMAKQMRMVPKLIGTHRSKILQMYDLLKMYKIDDREIRRCMGIFTIAVQTLKKRLAEVSKIPELGSVLNNWKILAIILQVDTSKDRLKLLEKLKVRCITLHMLLRTEEFCKEMARRGRDWNMLTEMRTFLNTWLECADRPEVMNNLKRHPNFRLTPLAQMKTSYQFLVDAGFEVSDLQRCAYILLYPSSKIEEALQKISTDLDRESLNKHDVLIIAVYFMEREHHFNGNGIYAEESDDAFFDDEDDVDRDTITDDEDVDDVGKDNKENYDDSNRSIVQVSNKS